MLKLIIFCPDEESIIQKIITAASDAGAGVMGTYTHCAFVSKGTGQWYSGEGSHPAVGNAGELSRASEARIEMQCREEKAQAVFQAVKASHPYEEPAIEFYQVLDLKAKP